MENVYLLKLHVRMIEFGITHYIDVFVKKIIMIMDFFVLKFPNVLMEKHEILKMVLVKLFVHLV